MSKVYSSPDKLIAVNNGNDNSKQPILEDCDFFLVKIWQDKIENKISGVLVP